MTAFARVSRHRITLCADGSWSCSLRGSSDSRRAAEILLFTQILADRFEVVVEPLGKLFPNAMDFVEQRIVGHV